MSLLLILKGIYTVRLVILFSWLNMWKAGIFTDEIWKRDVAIPSVKVKETQCSESSALLLLKEFWSLFHIIDRLQVLFGI